MWGWACKHGADPLFVIVQARRMDARVDAVYFQIAASKASFQSGSQALIWEGSRPGHPSTRSARVHFRTLSCFGSRTQIQHQTALLQRWTRKFSHRIDRMEQGFHILRHILGRDILASLQQVAPDVASMCKQDA